MSEKKITYSDCRVVYVPGHTGIVTFIRPDRDESLYMKEPLDKILKEYPEAKLYDSLDEVMVLITETEDKKIVTKFQEITKEQWWEMYECLPPLRTISQDDGLFFAFLMSEYWTSNITGHYFRIQERYFSAKRRDTENPGDMYQEIMKQFFIKQH